MPSEGCASGCRRGTMPPTPSPQAPASSPASQGLRVLPRRSWAEVRTTLRTGVIPPPTPSAAAPYRVRRRTGDPQLAPSGLWSPREETAVRRSSASSRSVRELTCSVGCEPGLVDAPQALFHFTLGTSPTLNSCLLEGRGVGAGGESVQWPVHMARTHTRAC